MRSASAKSRRRRAALALLDQPLDLLDRHRRLLVLGPPQADRRRARGRTRRTPRGRPATSPRAELAGVDRGVERAHELEHRAERRRPCSGRRCMRVARTPSRASLDAARRSRDATRRPVTVSSARQEVGQPPQRLLGLRQARPRELQLLAVVRRQQQVAQRRRPEALARRRRESCRRCRATSTSSRSSTIRCSTCIQKRENGLPVAPSLCAISFS